MDVSMPDMRFQSDKEISTQTGGTLAGLMEAAKPYLTAVLIVTILLSIWIGLRA
jgi:hypothetical protein